MDLHLLVVPYDSGHRGARMGAGPERLLASGLESALAALGQRVRLTRIELPSDAWSSEIGTTFELIRRVAAAIAADDGDLPIILAGNCITSLGALASYPSFRTGIVWFDAHGDFNTPDTTTSGFLDGTALSTITGGSWRRLALTVPGFRPLPEESVCVVGARDLDPVEKRALRGSGITLVAATEIGSAMQHALESIAGHADRVHVHIDLDVLDAGTARANTYAVGGGVTVDQMETALSMIGRALPIAGITLSAYDPAADTDGNAAMAAIRLLTAAVRAAQRAESPTGLSTSLDNT
ncbi:MAG TPA: arginase family protein [Gemmatimonadaceae bacterium]|nr:arginase family protein [Gemmatimonadaceae bacterium]